MPELIKPWNSWMKVNIPPKQYLEKAGVIERDVENAFLDLPFEDEDGLLHLQAASVSYRIAVGKDIGKKVLRLQTLPAKDEDNYGQLAKIDGFRRNYTNYLYYGNKVIDLNALRISRN